MDSLSPFLVNLSRYMGRKIVGLAWPTFPSVGDPSIKVYDTTLFGSRLPRRQMRAEQNANPISVNADPDRHVGGKGNACKLDAIKITGFLG